MVDMEHLRQLIKSDKNGDFTLEFAGYQIVGRLHNCGTLDTKIVSIDKVIDHDKKTYRPIMTPSLTKFGSDEVYIHNPDIHTIQNCNNIKIVLLEPLFTHILDKMIPSTGIEFINKQIKKNIDSDGKYKVQYCGYLIHGKGTVINLITSPDNIDVIPIMTTGQTRQDGIYYYIHCDRVSPHTTDAWERTYTYLIKWLHTFPTFVACNDYQSSKNQSTLSPETIKYIEKIERKHEKAIDALETFEEEVVEIDDEKKALEEKLKELKEQKETMENKRESLNEEVMTLKMVLMDLKALAK